MKAAKAMATTRTGSGKSWERHCGEEQPGNRSFLHRRLGLLPWSLERFPHPKNSFRIELERRKWEEEGREMVEIRVWGLGERMRSMAAEEWMRGVRTTS